MLELKNIHKKYYTDESSVEALKGVSIAFRSNEFVSVLGPSGGGKTTLLNIIGGLDHYTEGDLIINGKSTKRFLDADWDAYRNHSVGFVFQSYNLIPHQTVLANVELALTLSGVNKTERRERAVKALESVGLGDQLKKKPGEMSGGQMQRVAIARALVNDPEILLADEPTGALDTQTSVQVMDLLKEIAKDRLVIMVTHNPELAEAYSTRIVKLRDGEIIDDSNPYEVTEEETAASAPTTGKKHPSMSFFTALSLSLNNLLTKKTRTLLTALAGSIGIIGIALILSLSTGITDYINDIQQDAMDSFPLTVDKQAFDISSLMSSMPTQSMSAKNKHNDGKVYSNTSMVQQASAMSGSMKQNSMADFKKYLDNPSSEIQKYLGSNGVVYSYKAGFDIFAIDDEGTLINTDGTTFVNDNAAAQIMMNNDLFNVSDVMDMMNASGSVGNFVNCFIQLPSQPDGTGISDAVTTQYDLIYGTWPQEYNEVVLALDANGEIMSNYLYMMGLLPASQYNDIVNRVQAGETVEEEVASWTYEDICNAEFYLIPTCDQYRQNSEGYYDYLGASANEVMALTENGITLKIAGIIQVKDDNVAIPTIPAIGYTKALSDYVIDYAAQSEIVQAQTADTENDLLTGKPFAAEGESLLAKLVPAMSALVPKKSYEGNLEKLGVVNKDEPTSIAIYADTFEDKEQVIKCIEAYNDSVSEEKKIVYTDYVGVIMSSVSSIIKAVSIVLMGFVGVSLVVSSIMIGIITYISVLERKKEIGILRAIGASKRDVSRVFKAETFIVGLTAGALGVGITALLLLPINGLLHHFVTSVYISAAFPGTGAIILVVLSVVLTLIAGLIPSGIASRKDPVEALRSE
ncbi:MAG: ABC transporter ATP-binding protein/permease [Eubacterium sp.]|nr:ABC transporter ATP-binding protein/permease [Eubacterium sp.]